MPFKPKLIEALKSYSKKQLINDALAGLMVAIIAMPVSVAIAVASGVGPERGIYTSVIAGFLVAALGGSNVNITGPTAAFITLVYIFVVFSWSGIKTFTTSKLFKTSTASPKWSESK